VPAFAQERNPERALEHQQIALAGVARAEQHLARGEGDRERGLVEPVEGGGFEPGEPGIGGQEPVGGPRRSAQRTAPSLVGTSPASGASRRCRM